MAGHPGRPIYPSTKLDNVVASCSACSLGNREMHCFVSPSPSPAPAPLAAVTASTATRPPSTLPMFPVGRREHPHCLLRLRRPGETTALGRRGLAAVVRAQNHGNVQPPPLHPNHFAEETELISRRFMQIFCTFEGYLYKEAIEMSVQVCSCAEKAVAMASQVEDSARLTPQATTMHLALKAYVDVFVDTAEDSYKRRVTVKTVTKFLDALRGLVSTSHALLDAALEALSRTQPKESLAEYAFNCDVKNMQGEFDRYMAQLEHGIRNTTYSKSCQLVLPTIQKGVKATKSLLGVMAVRRERALGKANKVVP